MDITDKLTEYGKKEEGFEHLVYASSSSVYGGRKDVPFKETDDVSYPVSLYAATKKSNERRESDYG